MDNSLRLGALAGLPRPLAQLGALHVLQRGILVLRNLTGH